MKSLFAIFLSAMLAYGPVAHAQQAVQGGQWPDGTTLAWQCQKGSSGVVKFVFTTPDGKEYYGMFSCGTPV